MWQFNNSLEQPWVKEIIREIKKYEMIRQFHSKVYTWSIFKMNIKTAIQRDTCMSMFTAALFK